MSEFQQVPQPVFSTGDGTNAFDDNELLMFSDIFDDEMLPNRKSGVRKEVFDEDEDDGDSDEEGPKKRKTAGVPVAQLTKEEQAEKREKNREHAKRSRMRKKFLLDSLQRSVEVAEQENERLKEAIRKHLVADAEELISRCCKGSNITARDLLAGNSAESAAIQLNMPDYSLIKTLQSAMQSFVISDPALPDNPIVYASYGFLELTGYTNDQVLGRNCRFLQGSNTDIVIVRHIREHIDRGVESSSVLLNYRADGSTFWNQVYVSPLKNSHGQVVNFLGVQCKVTEEYAKAFLATQFEDRK